jgi:PAS domain S-box-containing protein
LSSRETQPIDALKAAIDFILRGSLCDARDVLEAAEVPDDAPLADVMERSLQLVDRLTTELSSKESALATVQGAMWDLEAAQQAIRASEARYRTTLASIGDGLIATDAQGCVEFMNPVAEGLTGWSVDDARGVRMTEVFRIFNAKTRAAAEDPVDRALREGVVVGLANHTTLVARDGTERQIADSCAPIHDDENRLLGAVLVFRDVTDEYLRREELRESEDRYRNLFEGAGEGILVVDVETGAFLHCNKTWCAMFGQSPEIVPHLGAADIHPEDAIALVTAEYHVQARGEKRVASDVPCRRRDGTVFYADIRTSAVRLKGRSCIIRFFADASERKSYEQQLESERSLREMAEIELRHAQKLQAVGQLAAGVAHEINTPAQFVGDSITFLTESFKEVQDLVARYRHAVATLAGMAGCEAIVREMEEAEDAADLSYIEQKAPAAFERALDGIARISSIVSAMKEFAHPDQREKSAADLNRALQTTLTIAKNEYKYVANIETDLGHLPPVTCHLGDMNQVFLNLLVNAAHAIADVVGDSGSKGRIRVQTARDGDSVRVEIADTGCGIPEEIRDRVFEPFFTTKAVGRGSGQGLAIARSIVVDKHGGALTFESEVGRGTTFIILLPVDGTAPPSSA